MKKCVIIFLFLAVGLNGLALNAYSNLNDLFENNKQSVVKVLPFVDNQANDKRHLNNFLEEFFGQPFHAPRSRNKAREKDTPKSNNDQQANGLGSGIIMDKSGYIVTNYHVVNNALSIKVQLHNNEEYTAKVVGLDELSDLAVLKINPNRALNPIKIGNSDTAKIGDSVVAIGAPFGFDYSLTAGIISAKKRSLGLGSRYIPFLQTDVAINPGSSGGPLLNMNGEVIGINSLIITPVGSYAGLSFAIPFNLVQVIYEQIKRSGQVSRAWLGIEIHTLDKKIAQSLGIESESGVLVSGVKTDAPADVAGIQPGDVILSFNGKALQKSSQLPPLVASSPVGSSVELKILRNNNYKIIEVELLNMGQYNRTSNNHDFLKNELSSVDVNVPVLGINVVVLPQIGLKINFVEKNSLALLGGLKKDDVIINAMSDYSDTQRNIHSVNGLNSVIDTVGKEEYLALSLQREDRKFFLTLKIK